MQNYVIQALQNIYVQHDIREDSKSASTKRGNILWKRSKYFFKNNKAIKSNEMMNSSNYTLVTYLSDIESKFILCQFCMVLANLSF